ncbi:hypothetical protein MKX01_032838 [Papaver californicum]|nr:hypothetical protein MKX01_032838 [Papaver californicum]
MKIKHSFYEYILLFRSTETLVKIDMFMLFQALVYLILLKSSNIFSKKTRSLNIKIVRSASIRQIMTVLSDLPDGDEPYSSSVKG